MDHSEPMDAETARRVEEEAREAEEAAAAAAKSAPGPLAASPHRAMERTAGAVADEAAAAALPNDAAAWCRVHGERTQDGWAYWREAGPDGGRTVPRCNEIVGRNAAHIPLLCSREVFASRDEAAAAEEKVGMGPTEQSVIDFAEALYAGQQEYALFMSAWQNMGIDDPEAVARYLADRGEHVTPVTEKLLGLADALRALRDVIADA